MHRMRCGEHFGGALAGAFKQITIISIGPFLWRPAIGKRRIEIIAFHPVQRFCMAEKMPRAANADIADHFKRASFH